MIRQYLPLILSVIVAPLLTALVYRWQARVRVEEMREQTKIRTTAADAQTPVDVLRAQLIVKDQEITQTRAQFFEFLQSERVRSDAMTNALLDVAAEARAQSDVLRSIGTSLQAHRDESSARAGKTYEKIGTINERLATIEGHILRGAS